VLGGTCGGLHVFGAPLCLWVYVALCMGQQVLLQHWQQLKD
jgi:hypothetical protein